MESGHFSPVTPRSEGPHTPGAVLAMACTPGFLNGWCQGLWSFVVLDQWVVLLKIVNENKFANLAELLIFLNFKRE